MHFVWLVGCFFSLSWALSVFHGRKCICGTLTLVLLSSWCLSLFTIKFCHTHTHTLPHTHTHTYIFTYTHTHTFEQFSNIPPKKAIISNKMSPHHNWITTDHINSRSLCKLYCTKVSHGRNHTTWCLYTYNHSRTFSAQNDILRVMGLEQETTTFYYQSPSLISRTVSVDVKHHVYFSITNACTKYSQ